MGTTKKSEEGVTRRKFLKTSLLSVAACGVGSSFGIVKARGEQPVTFGLLGNASGAGGMTGESALFGVKLWAEALNKKGGLLGREVQVIQRDTFGKPEEAARYTREFASSGNIDFIFAHGSSAESFAVAAISKDLKRLITSQSEATDFTADPKVRSPYCFRFSTNSLLTAIAFGQYGGKISKEQGFTRWFTVGPDYSFGRDLANLFTQYLKKSNPAADVRGQAWPKLFESDYTPQINAIMAANPQAVMTCLFGADLIAFIKQGAMYGLFDKVKLFATHLGDEETIQSITKAIGKFPAGLHARVRYLRGVPDTAPTHAFYDEYVKRFNTPPLYWAWMNYLGAISVEAAVKKAKSVDNAMVIKALENMSVKGPGGVGVGDTIMMRGRDHQLINYVEASGVTISQPPYLNKVVYTSWKDLVAEETAWLKNKGWL